MNRIASLGSIHTRVLMQNYEHIPMTLDYSQKFLAVILSLVLVSGLSSASFATEGPPPDSDNDTVPDNIDKCEPTPANQGTADQDGCTDQDGDGIKGFVDDCLETPPATQVDEFGCALPDSPVAGDLLSLDSSALVIGGLTSSAVWMIPAVAGITGAGIYLVKTRANRD